MWSKETERNLKELAKLIQRVKIAHSFLQLKNFLKPTSKMEI